MRHSAYTVRIVDNVDEQEMAISMTSPMDFLRIMAAAAAVAANNTIVS